MVVGGGRALSLGGCFFQPSVLVGANTDMQLAHEETFGPVAPIIRWESCYRGTAEGERIGTWVEKISHFLLSILLAGLKRKRKQLQLPMPHPLA